MTKAGPGARHRLIVALMLALIGVAASAADRVSLSGLTLPQIDGSHHRAELAPKTTAGIVVVFEDQCSYCLAMMRTAQRIGDAHGWHVLAVGVGPSPPALLAWARRADVRMPILHANTRFLARIGGVKVTPLTLLVDCDGHIRRRFVGNVDGAAVEEAMDGQSP